MTLGDKVSLRNVGFYKSPSVVVCQTKIHLNIQTLVVFCYNMSRQTNKNCSRVIIVTVHVSSYYFYALSL